MNPPDDFDTTSLALCVVPPQADIVHFILDEMLKWVNPDGIPYAYYDDNRPRIDPACCVSVLIAFHKYQRGHQMQKEREWIWDILFHRAYLDGTYYYRSADWFLFWVHRFVRHAGHYPSIQEKFKSLLKQRIQERIGVPGDALVLAMRLTICHGMGVPNYQDFEMLKELQCEDGGREQGYMYSIPIVGRDIYVRGFTTALAVQAIQERRSLDNGQIVDGEAERI